jgi:DNA (cytosine-5)-methyltransferase 1
MRVVSLFSGAGGLDLGLINSGHEIIWANDIFLDAAETYRRNIGDHIDTRDICEIPSHEIPHADVVVGGFPCQGFSVANWGRHSSDPRNKLYRELVRVVRDKQPKFFIGENVKGLTSMEKGAVLRQIVSDFEDCGYSVKWHLVNSADYGVPQFRKRVIIIGVRNDLGFTMPEKPIETHADPLVAVALKRKPWLSVGSALMHIPEPEDAPWIANHTGSKYKLRFNGHLGHRFIEPARPAPTVTARGDEKGGVVVLHHPGNHRRMTVRELAAVQSFPDDFEFFGTTTSGYRQIGNAVPPKLGLAIGKLLSSAEAKCRTRELIEA